MINIEDIRAYCLRKKGVTEDFPFDDETLVFKVMGKMFLLMNINQVEISVNLKCEPELAVEWREKYESVQPGYHMNKKHWNTVYCERGLDDKLIRELVGHSYELIVQSLPKAQRQELEQL